MALEYYDSCFGGYAAELAESTERCIEDARAAFAAAADREVAQVQRTVSEKVAETIVTIARGLTERPVGTRREIHRVTMFRPWWWRSARCARPLVYSLRGPLKPFWAMKTETLAPLDRKSTRLNSSHRCISY